MLRIFWIISWCRELNKVGNRALIWGSKIELIYLSHNIDIKSWESGLYLIILRNISGFSKPLIQFKIFRYSHILRLNCGIKICKLILNGNLIPSILYNNTIIEMISTSFQGGDFVFLMCGEFTRKMRYKINWKLFQNFLSCLKIFTELNDT